MRKPVERRKNKRRAVKRKPKPDVITKLLETVTGKRDKRGREML